MKPKEFFPNMPDEVFNNWLGEIIRHHGWPFKSPCDDTYYGQEWKNCFAPYTLNQWTKINWELIYVPVEILNIRDTTAHIIRDIIFNAVKSHHASSTHITSSKKRFWACASFYANTGTVPCPIIILNYGGSTRILDGFHRLASIIHIGVTPRLIIPAWNAKYKGS